MYSVAHVNGVAGAAGSLNGLADKQVLTASWDGTTRLWETVSGAELALFEHYLRVTSVAFAPDGRSVLTGSWDGLGRRWLLDRQFWPSERVNDTE